MDEARRFIRYVIPGLSFVVEAILLLWLIQPHYWWSHLAFALSHADKGIGVAIGTLLGSGGLGFVFSMAHHSLLWCLDGRRLMNLSGHLSNLEQKWLSDNSLPTSDKSTCCKRLKSSAKARLSKLLHWIRCSLFAKLKRWITGAVDHRDVIHLLRQRNILLLIDPRTGNLWPEDRRPTRLQAWSIVAALWHERVENSDLIKASNPRADSLANLVHSLGAARISSLIATVMAVLITSFRFDVACLQKTNMIIAIATATILFIVHQYAYITAGDSQRYVVEQIFVDTLSAEFDPIETNVMLD